MARIKNTPSKKSASSVGARKSLMKLKNITDAGTKSAKKKLGAVLLQTKLKVPFKPASAAAVASAKKGLLKQLKRR